jgi:predicted O-methyltransferase YrrM
MVTFKENLVTGQMHPEERKELYDTIIKSKPNICVECGTWKGGGSTFFIANALSDIGKGKLHTWEINSLFYKEAIAYFNTLPELKKYVDFNFEDFHLGIEKLSKIDFAFLDGPNDPQYTLQSINMLLPKMKSQSYIVLHDWKIQKCQGVKEFINNNKNILIIEKVLNSETGLGVLKKI